MQATPTPTTTSASGGFSLVLPFGTIVFTKFPFFITIAHAETKLSTPTPLAPITKSLSQMNICDASGVTKFPDSCLQLASETPDVGVAVKRHKRGIFDFGKSVDTQEESASAGENNSSNSVSGNSDIKEKSLVGSSTDEGMFSSGNSVASDSELNNIAWSGIDNAEFSSEPNSAMSSSVPEEPAAAFDIPLGNFLLTPDSESERPATVAAASFSSDAVHPGNLPTTLIFIESSITIDIDDSLSSGHPDKAPVNGLDMDLPSAHLSELQSSIVSAQHLSVVSAKQVFSAQESIIADPNGLQKGLNECVSGMMRCVSDNLGFDTCLFGKWGTVRACAKGTSCITLPDNNIACA
ncbi:hypothetical protein IWW45_000928 [Coemansia sp. RSA 485]|nr:hypothetical protein IWW45_000928 [Coemansia sp. RSA 485]